MGVHGLWSVLESTGQPIAIQSLKGKVLAVDVSIWLHQSVKGFRDKDGNPLKNAHLLGVFFRVCKLLNYGIKPVFVFDGGVPALKRQTLISRKQKKLEAQDNSEVTRRKLLSNLIQSQLQTQTKKAIPQSLLIEAGIAELTASAKKLKSPTKKRTNKDSEYDENDLEKLRAKLECNESINSSLFSGSQAIIESDSSSCSDDDYRGGRNYAEHFSSIVSTEFDNLPLEIQHEILFEMQESKKNNSWAKVNEMPKELHNFSSFQMDRLVKRRFLQKKIQSVQKEMGNRHIHVQNLDELINFENEFGVDCQTEVIGSKEKGAVLIKLKPNSSMETNSNPGPSSAKTDSCSKRQILPEGITIDDFIEEWPSGSDDSDTEKTNEGITNPNIKGPISVTLTKSNASKRQDVEDNELALAIELSLQENRQTKVVTQTKTKIANNPTVGRSTDQPAEESSNWVETKTIEVVELELEEDAELEKAIKLSKSQHKNSIPGTYAADSVHCPQVTASKASGGLPDQLNDLLSNSNKPIQQADSLSQFNIILRENSSISSTCNKFFDKVGFFEVPSKTIGTNNSITNLMNDSKPCYQTLEGNENSDSDSSSTNDDDFEEVEEEGTAKSLAATPVQTAHISIHIDKNMQFTKEDDIFSDLFDKFDDNTKESEEAVGDFEEVQVRDSLFPTPIECENSATEVTSINSSANGVVKNSSSSSRPMLSMEFLQAQEKLNTDNCNLHNLMGAQDRIATSITDQMYLETQELLELFGIPFLTSPMEAESQCAFLDLACLSDGTITDDSDIFLFGGRRVFKNFFSQGEKPVQFFQYADIVSKLHLDREKLVLMAILTGSDYTNGVEGVGPVRALEILSEFPSEGTESFESLQKFSDWWKQAQENELLSTNKIRKKFQKIHLRSGFPSKAVYDAYMDPAIDSSTERFHWGTINEDALKTYIRHKFGWDAKKCESTLLPVLKSIAAEHNKEKQLTLDSFVTLRPLITGKRKIKSKRLANAMKKLKRGVKDLADEVNLSSDSSGSESPVETKSSNSRKRSAGPNKNAAKTSVNELNKVQESKGVKKVRIPKPSLVIPQKVQEENQKKLNKLRAIATLKNKKSS